MASGTNQAANSGETMNPNLLRNAMLENQHIRQQLEESRDELTRTRRDLYASQNEVARLNGVVARMGEELETQRARTGQSGFVGESGPAQARGGQALPPTPSRRSSTRTHTTGSFQASNYGPTVPSQLAQVEFQTPRGPNDSINPRGRPPAALATNFSPSGHRRNDMPSSMGGIPVPELQRRQSSRPHGQHNRRQSPAPNMPTHEMGRMMIGRSTSRSKTPSASNSASHSVSFSNPIVDTNPPPPPHTTHRAHTPGAGISGFGHGEVVISHGADATPSAFQEDAGQLFNAIRDWSTRYMSTPKAADRSMPPDFRTAMAKVTYSYNVNHFFSDSNYRPLMVARYMIEFVTSVVWRPNLVRDFEPAMIEQQEIKVARERLRTEANIPEIEKRALHTLLAGAHQSIKQHSSFAAFLNVCASRCARQLWNDVRFFFDVEQDSYAATEELRVIVNRAWVIGMEMLCTTKRFKYDYLRPSNTSFFNKDYMENIDPHEQGTSAQELKARDMRITATITPVITVTEIVADTINPRTELKAGVLMHS